METMDQEKPEEQTEGVEQEATIASEGGNTTLDLVIDVPVRLTVEVGSTQMLVREVLQLGKGSVVELDRNSGDPADILVNNRLVARGEVTTIEDRLAIRVVEVVGGDAAGGRPG
jgi:flagellar motor switch protein FliN/FliY